MSRKLISIAYFIAPLAILTQISCANNKSSNSESNAITDFFEKTAYNEAIVVANIATHIADANFVHNGDSLKQFSDLKILYNTDTKNLYWVKGSKLNKNATTLLSKIDSLEKDGIPSSTFNLDHIQSLATKLKKAPENEQAKIAEELELSTSIAAIKSGYAMLHGLYKDSFAVEHYNAGDTSIAIGNTLLRLFAKDSVAYYFDFLRPQIKEYSIFQKKLAELQSIKKKGGWPVWEVSTKKELSAEEIVSLRKRLFIEIGIPADTSNPAIEPTLEAAIMKFQYLHDIKLTSQLDSSTQKRLALSVDDKIKKVKLNLDRLRWLKRSMPQPYVWVNVPQMDLKYYDHDSAEFQMKVVVGRVSRATPTLDAEMSNIVFNPPWSVPETIMKEEIIPGVKRRGKDYLSRRGLKAFKNGREVNPSMITEKNFKAFAIQQKPGLNSSLGAVKFNLPNRHAIYLHDTPHREDFVKNYRAYSSGCIRVHHPREFAEFILKDSNFTKAKIDSMVKTRITKEKTLAKKIPVHIVYLTSGTDSLGNFKYLRDIYSYDDKLKKMNL